MQGHNLGYTGTVDRPSVCIPRRGRCPGQLSELPPVEYSRHIEDTGTRRRSEQVRFRKGDVLKGGQQKGITTMYDHPYAPRGSDA